MKSSVLSVKQAIEKAESFCAYQDRSHYEVIRKLRGFGMTPESIDFIVTHLIERDFLNEERFARSFARGKHRIKSWGIPRIESELKARGISTANIKIALAEIDQEEYTQQFDKIAQHKWETLLETDLMKKKKKVFDYLIRKGYNTTMVYDKIAALSKDSDY